MQNLGDWLVVIAAGFAGGLGMSLLWSLGRWLLRRGKGKRANDERSS